MTTSIFENDWENLCIPTLFEHQVTLTPDRIALWTEEGTWSYDQLNKRANQIAHWLLTQGIQHEDIIGLNMRRTHDFFAALWGVLKAGAAWLYLSPDAPKTRLVSQIQETKTRIVLSDQRESIPAGIDTFFLSHLRIEQENGVNPNIEIETQALAYVMFTSGSKRQKGVLISHKGLPHLAHAQVMGFGITPEDRLSQFLVPTFDAFLSELLTAHLAGAALVVVPDHVRLLPENITAFLSEQEITVATFTPTVLRLLQPDTLPLLRIVISGGEICTPDVVQQWSTPDRRVINAYGPTEATVCVCVAECQPNGWQPSLGYPIPGTTITIRDVTLHLSVSAGTTGEICIAGLSLARGYIDAEQTAQKFIVDPVQPSEERIYLTGDLGMMENGEVFFQGRIDDELKLAGGYRVAPGEIERALRSLVKDVAVLLIEDVLIACVVQEEDHQFTEVQLRTNLSQFLPSYMMPRQFLYLPTLPRNEHDKVDKKALQQAVRNHWSDPSVARYAVSDLEWQVATLVAESYRRATEPLLKPEEINLRRSFGQLGASSLATASLLLGLERQFGVELDPNYVTDSPLIEVIHSLKKKKEIKP